ncbi:MAG: hypothetical protein WD512_12675, partial [Candidatus Paceibacterota bacterium]
MLTYSETGIINEINKGNIEKNTDLNANNLDSNANNLNSEDINNNSGGGSIRRNIWDDLKKTFEIFTYDCKNLLIDLGVPISHEYTGRIVDVQPICAIEDMPLGYRDGRCYHLVTTADGLIFKLIFWNVRFSTLTNYLQPNRIVKITYKDPDFRVVNIFPQRLYRMLSYGQFIEEYNPNINKNSLVRICSLDEKIIKVEFLEYDLNKNEEQVNIHNDHIDDTENSTLDSHKPQYDLVA